MPNKVSQEVLNAICLMEESVADASKSRYWCHEVAQRLLPGRDALFGLLESHFGDAFKALAYLEEHCVGDPDNAL